MPRLIPPDPDKKNRDRARWAREAVRAFQEITRTQSEPLDTVIGDLITDLAHLCDERRYDLRFEIERAKLRYSEETAGQGIQFD